MKKPLQLISRTYRMSFFILVLINVVFSYTANAQWQNGLWIGKQANNFVYAGGMHIDFSTNPPASSVIPYSWATPGPSVYYEGSASISDGSSGELSFYEFQTPLSFKFMDIYNKNHQVMDNGNAIAGGNMSMTQKSIIIPKPNSATNYFIFAINSHYNSSPANQSSLYYSEVDMSLDNGLGAVVVKNTPVMPATMRGEKMTAVHHANKTDVWLINDFDRYADMTLINKYSRVLITAEGASPAEIVDGYPNFNTASGQMKFSPDGSKLAEINTGASLVLYDFDNQTGQLSNPVDLTAGFQIANGSYQGGFGLEFSPDGRYLYVTDGLSNISAKLYQFDTHAGDQAAILASKVLVHGMPGLTAAFQGMQLGPDGKIYIILRSHWQTGHADFETLMYVINNPNNAGQASGFSSYSQGVPDSLAQVSQVSHPGFVQSFFESGILYESNCLDQPVAFSTIRIPDITSIAWDFGDGNNGTGITPTHTYTQPGTYVVTASITSNNAIQTTTTEIIINEGVNAAMPGDLFACQADATVNAVFDLSQQDEAILDGQNPDDYAVTYHDDLNEAENNSDPITTPDTYSAADGTVIYARVTDSAGCYALTQFTLQSELKPVAVAVDPIIVCDTGILDGLSVMDLTQRASDLKEGQPDTQLSYFENFEDADANTGGITDPSNYTNIQNPQTIFVRIAAANVQDDCYAIAELSIVVEASNFVDTPLELIGCSPFDLTRIATEIGNGYNFSYFESEDDAGMNANAIDDSQAYAPVTEGQSVYVRITDADGCVQVAELSLVTGDCNIPQGFSPNGDGTNESFDLSFVSATYGGRDISIFNRYGTVVYEANNYTDQWNGQDKNGQNLPTGTYFYVLHLDMPHPKYGNAIKKWVYLQR